MTRVRLVWGEELAVVGDYEAVDAAVTDGERIRVTLDDGRRITVHTGTVALVEERGQQAAKRAVGFC